MVIQMAGQRVYRPRRDPRVVVQQQDVATARAAQRDVVVRAVAGAVAALDDLDVGERAADGRDRAVLRGVVDNDHLYARLTTLVGGQRGERLEDGLAVLVVDDRDRDVHGVSGSR